MGTSQPAYKRLWLPFGVGVLLVAAAIGLGLWALLRGGGHTPGAGTNHAPVAVPKSAPPQARWKIGVNPAGSLGKPSRKEMKEVSRAKPKVKRLVTDTFDALLLVPRRYHQVVRRYFVHPAASTLLSTKLAPPSGARHVSTKMRRALIGVQVPGAHRAAAKVKVRAKAKLHGRPVKWSEAATLWLDKEHGHWRVLGFSLDQAPIGTGHHKTGKHHRSGGGKGGRHHRSHGGKKG